MIASANTAEGRAQIFAKLVRRNKIIDVLRWAVPAPLIVVLSFLVAYAALTETVLQFSVGGVRLEAGALIIDQPSYAGSVEGGGTYVLKARSATTNSLNTDSIDLVGARMTITGQNGDLTLIEAEAAQLELTKQKVAVPEIMMVTSPSGTKAQFSDAFIDWAGETLTSYGPALIMFTDGAVLEAANAINDQKAGKWVFEAATIRVPGREETGI